MIVRTAELSDFEAIKALSKELFISEKPYSDVFDENWPYLNEGKEYLARRLVNDKNIVLVAEDAGKVVGYLLGLVTSMESRKANPIAEIENLYLQEAYRNSGSGTKMLEMFKEEARKKGVKRLRVMAHWLNKNVHRFYKQQGFDEFALVFEQDL